MSNIHRAGLGGDDEGSAEHVHSDKTPAQQRAGGQVKHGETRGIKVASELVARLEAILYMYERMSSFSVGTAKVESEAWNIVKESLCGPTGLWRLREEKDRRVLGCREDVNSDTECDHGGGDRRDRRHSTHDVQHSVPTDSDRQDNKCWRNEKVVNDLTKIRVATIKDELKLAKQKLRETVNWVVSQTGVSKQKVDQQTRRIMNLAGKEARKAKDKKVKHRRLVATLCIGHLQCREMDKIMEERTKGWDPVTGRLSVSRGETVVDPPPLSTRKMYMTRESDLQQLDKEKADVLEWCGVHNRAWSKMNQDRKRFGDMGETEQSQQYKDEVVVFGNVTLSDNERQLLNLGPDFMVIGRLDMQEMRKETAVTMTKIRWGRRSSGQEGMTQSQRSAEDQETEEEEMERQRIESQARDIINDEGDSVDMRRLRATDMKNNRHVMMPGPSGVVVEAENKVREDIWVGEYRKYMDEFCNVEGEQIHSNIPVSLRLALKGLQRKVAKKELVVCQADKGKKIVVMDTDMYLKMAEDHVVPERRGGTCGGQEVAKVAVSHCKDFGQCLGGWQEPVGEEFHQVLRQRGLGG